MDRPVHRFDETVDFWVRATDSSLSPRRGARDEFATLLPADGSDAHLRVQATRSDAPGSHLDLHVSDVRRGIEECLRAGGSMIADRETYAVLATPGGMVFCVVAHRGERTRQRPVVCPDGTKTLVDQVCLDVDPDSFEDEVRFWSSVTGWAPLPARAHDFLPLDRPASMPLRLMFQLRGVASGTSSCHLDVACEDVRSAVALHESLGAVAGATHRYWTVMTDPAGAEYCLTMRRPDTGQLPP